MHQPAGGSSAARRGELEDRFNKKVWMMRTEYFPGRQHDHNPEIMVPEQYSSVGKLESLTVPLARRRVGALLNHRTTRRSRSLSQPRSSITYKERQHKTLVYTLLI